ncbi:substrate-binding domain-containing protein [Clostridia bacterium OttesenSCG-928-O13]|nr:substrate-binding domain-containing protein [Clostridia bacterium OttesenSCG-928-O13]
MKRSLALAMALVLMFALAACGGSASSTPPPASVATGSTAPASGGDAGGAKEDITIAGIYKSGDQQWFIGEGDAAKAKCLEMGATEFTYVDVKLDPDLYLRAIDDAITKGVDGILTCPPDQKMSQVVVDKCKEAGIPVIACDDALQDENGEFLAPFVGIDAYAIGKAVGEWTADYVEENDMTGDDVGVLYLTANTVSSCVPRTEGEMEVWGERFPDWPAANTFEADYTGPQDEAFNQAAAIFTANPQIKSWVIMTINDEGAAGATRALEQAGLDADAVVVGIGGYLAKLEFQKPEGSAFKATAFINYVDVGAYSAENMMNYLVNGTEIPMDFRTPAVMVTADDYVEIMKDQAE